MDEYFHKNERMSDTRKAILDSDRPSPKNDPEPLKSRMRKLQSNYNY